MEKRQIEKECHLGKKEDGQSGTLEKKESAPLKEGEFQGEKKKQAKIAFIGEVEGSLNGEWTQKFYRSIGRVLVSLQVWPSLKWKRKLKG